MEKQIIINCPNKESGYPKDGKKRRNRINSEIVHCKITNKIWNDNLIYIGPGIDGKGGTEFEYVDCECIKK